MAQHNPDKFADGASRGNGSGTDHGYRVEARMNYVDPVAWGDQIFDREWREVQFHRAPIGVPHPFPTLEAARHNLFGQAQAEALRWWFLADLAAGRGSHFGMETRLVEYTVEYTFKITRKKTCPAKDCLGKELTDVIAAPAQGDADAP